MSVKYTNKLKILLWISIVYILSFICYLPVLLEQHGMVLANCFLFLKYLFVCIPAITATLMLICEHELRTYVEKMFSGKIAIKHIWMWVIFIAIGILISFVLGVAYYQCRNVLLIALLHVTFNICYLAPIQYNIVVLAIINAIDILLIKKKYKVLEE